MTVDKVYHSVCAHSTKQNGYEVRHNHPVIVKLTQFLLVQSTNTVSIIYENNNLSSVLHKRQETSALSKAGWKRIKR